VSVAWIAFAGGLVALLILVGALAWLTARSIRPDERSLIQRVLRLPLKAKFRLAFALLRDKRMPLAVRAIPAALVLYLAMPVDLIPDFIPVIGHLDDLLAVLVGFGLLLRFTPRQTLEDALRRLEADPDPQASV
jgi:uncharacterized membrane protein YkvA (DUF1232 family)